MLSGELTADDVKCIRKKVVTVICHHQQTYKILLLRMLILFTGVHRVNVNTLWV